VGYFELAHHQILELARLGFPPAGQSTAPAIIRMRIDLASREPRSSRSVTVLTKSSLLIGAFHDIIRL
jgi:hypothetical protein